MNIKNVTLSSWRQTAAYRAKREARTRRSGRTIEEISELEEEDEDERTIPNEVWYSADVMVPIPEHAITLSTEKHQAREEFVPYLPLIIIDANTEVEEDPDEPESTDSGVA
ncbi:hypothetical protein TanjilG_28830 [Lupinus angustifolius]|uniref:Uncharacterized protein n=1 Tax=Lupinus angustifolius TaxID=3871 RepID=A0A4P1R8R1_LUPAN|nr:hypothetical protein TanjilG_28830 [Lupinus angustifolius]